MKKLLAMVMALVILGAVCYAEKNPTIVGSKKLIVTVTDAYIIDDYTDKDSKALCIEFRVSNNADHERVFQCEKALINETSEVSAWAWVSVGAHAIKNESIIVSLKEARMSDVSSLTSIVFTMSVYDTSGDNAFRNEYIKGGPKADWIKEKVAAHNQQDLGHWQNH